MGLERYSGDSNKIWASTSKTYIVQKCFIFYNFCIFIFLYFFFIFLCILYFYTFEGEWTNGSNILGLVVFAVVFGIALATMGEKGKPLLDFFTALRYEIRLSVRLSELSVRLSASPSACPNSLSVCPPVRTLCQSVRLSELSVNLSACPNSLSGCPNSLSICPVVRTLCPSVHHSARLY